MAGTNAGEPEVPRRIDTKATLTALALGPSGVLATGGGGGLQLWVIRTLAPLPPLTTHLDRIRKLRFSRDGWLAAAGGQAGVELWDPATSSLVALLPTPAWVDELAFSPSGSGRTIRGAPRKSWRRWPGVTLDHHRLSGGSLGGRHPDHLQRRPDRPHA